MDIIVCVKHVPETAEAEIEVRENGRGVNLEGLVFDINEWDDYALEEALLIKEKFGGTVTVITVGNEEADETLRKCLAKGADKAIRLSDPAFEESDAYATAKILYAAIKKMPFDLIFTGVQASDDGYAQVGVTLAELLGVPHATLVKKIEFMDNNFVRVHRELEGGLEEVVDLKIPALLTIQTGINEPRYVSIMGIRRARAKKIEVLGLEDLGLKKEDVGPLGSWIRVEEMFLPKAEKETVILKGTLDEIATEVAKLLKARGLV